MDLNDRKEYIEDLGCLWKAIADPLERFEFLYQGMSIEIDLPFDLKVELAEMLAKEIHKELENETL